MDSWGQLRVYDPYLKPNNSADGRARGEAYLFSQHGRVSSARLYPVSYEPSRLDSNVARLVNTNNQLSPLPEAQLTRQEKQGSLELKRAGDFAKLPSISRKDLEEISRMTQAEAGAGDRAGQLRVAGVIFNRMMSSEFPNTAHGVLHQKLNPKSDKYQFSPMHDGRFNTFRPDHKIVSDLIAMIESGKNPAQDALYFQARSIGMNNWMGRNRQKILSDNGHHFFA